MSKMLFSESPLVIDKVLAKAIGINEAIVLQQVHYWLEINKKKALNYIDGRYWTYNSIKNWHEEHFSFWTEKTVKRAFSALVEKGLLITGNYNRQKMDRTLWYSIDYEKLEEIYRDLNSEEGENALGQNDPMEKDKKSQCNETKSPNGKGQNDPMHRDNLTQPIPKTYSETYTEISTETSLSLSSIQKTNNDDGAICDTDFYNSEYQEVIECFNKNIHEAAQVEKDKLKSWLDVMPRECIIYAIEASVMADVKTMNYINKVLNSLFTSGVTNKEQLGKYIQDFENNRTRINQNSNGPDKSSKDEYDHDVSEIRSMLGTSKNE